MKIVTALVLLLLLSACSLPVFFRVPVVQGNIVTAKKVDRLKLGMNKRQVKYIMGSSLVDPSFEKDRWDYVFYYRDPRAHVRHSALELYFSGDKLAKIGGDEQFQTQGKGSAQKSLLGNQPLPTTVTPGPNHRTAPRQVPPASNNRPLPSQAIPDRRNGSRANPRF